MKNLLTYSMIVLLMLACGKNRDLEEGDRNTYTIKGRVFKGISDEPFANKTLYLEMAESGISENSSNVIAETSTDADGYFSMTYKQLKNTNDATVALVAPGAGTPTNLIKSLPINENIESDFASIPHARITIDIEVSEPLNDSLILSINGLAEGENILKLNINKGGLRPYLVVFPSKNSINRYEIKTYVISYTPEGKINQGLRYGIGRSDLIKAANANYSDTIPDDYNEYWCELAGFPHKDTIYLAL